VAVEHSGGEMKAIQPLKIDDVVKNQIEPYKAFVKPHYAGKDSAHDFRHIERIINRLTMLSKGISEQVRPERLCFLTCFHGLGKQVSSSKDFNEQVQTFLKSLGWSTEDIEDAFQSLYRHLTNPRSVEEKSFMTQIMLRSWVLLA
jgi:hypothetical protein